MGEPNRDRPTVIGVDLGGTKVRAGRVAGDALERSETRRISADRDAQTVIDEIVGTIAAVIGPTVAGIGIGVPSLVDVVRGIVYSVENIPSWREVHLREIMENRFQIPVVVNNDANCFALGELYYGAGRGIANLVGITLGTGLGAGIVIEGRLYSGWNCGAGEIGCIPYRDQTIEAYCSGQFFQREGGRDGGEVFRMATAGDPTALELYERFGHELGMAVMTVLYAYDPEVVVFGGSIAAAFPFFEGALRRRLGDFAYPHALGRVRITCSQRDDMAVLGAAALVFDAAARRMGAGD